MLLPAAVSRLISSLFFLPRYRTPSSDSSPLWLDSLPEPVLWQILQYISSGFISQDYLNLARLSPRLRDLINRLISPKPFDDEIGHIFISISKQATIVEQALSIFERPISMLCFDEDSFIHFPDFPASPIITSLYMKVIPWKRFWSPHISLLHIDVPVESDVEYCEMWKHISSMRALQSLTIFCNEKDSSSHWSCCFTSIRHLRHPKLTSLHLRCFFHDECHPRCKRLSLRYLPNLTNLDAPAYLLPSRLASTSISNLSLEEYSRNPLKFDDAALCLERKLRRIEIVEPMSADQLVPLRVFHNLRHLSLHLEQGAEEALSPLLPGIQSLRLRWSLEPEIVHRSGEWTMFYSPPDLPSILAHARELVYMSLKRVALPVSHLECILKCVAKRIKSLELPVDKQNIEEHEYILQLFFMLMRLPLQQLEELVIEDHVHSGQYLMDGNLWCGSNVTASDVNLMLRALRRLHMKYESIRTRHLEWRILDCATAICDNSICVPAGVLYNPDEDAFVLVSSNESQLEGLGDTSQSADDQNDGGASENLPNVDEAIEHYSDGYSTASSIQSFDEIGPHDLISGSIEEASGDDDGESQLRMMKEAERALPSDEFSIAAEHLSTVSHSSTFETVNGASSLSESISMSSTPLSNDNKREYIETLRRDIEVRNSLHHWSGSCDSSHLMDIAIAYASNCKTFADEKSALYWFHRALKMGCDYKIVEVFLALCEVELREIDEHLTKGMLQTCLERLFRDVVTKTPLNNGQLLVLAESLKEESFWHGKGEDAVTHPLGFFAVFVFEYILKRGYLQEAVVQVSRMYVEGCNDVAQDGKKAQEWLERGVAHNDTYVMNMLAKYFLHQPEVRGIAYQPARAKMLLEKAIRVDSNAQSESNMNMITLAGLLKDGADGVRKDVRRAEKLLRKGIELSSRGEALYELGLLLRLRYDEGEGDLEEAVHCLQEAVDEGNSDAATVLMYLYRDGYNEMERDLRKAELYFGKSSLVNDADELYEFAVLFERGEGADVEKAVWMYAGVFDVCQDQDWKKKSPIYTKSVWKLFRYHLSNRDHPDYDNYEDPLFEKGIELETPGGNFKGLCA